MSSTSRDSHDRNGLCQSALRGLGTYEVRDDDGETVSHAELFVGIEMLEPRVLLSTTTLIERGPMLEDYVPLPAAVTAFDSAPVVSEAQVIGFDPLTRVQTILPEDDGLGQLEAAAHSLGFAGLDELAEFLHSDSDDGFVFGTDQRTRVADTTAYPHRAIGRMWMEFGGQEFSCSAALIGPYHILTAGHCVHQGAGGTWADRIRFSAGQDHDRVNGSFRRSEFQPYGEAAGTYFRSFTGWTNSSNYDYDIALITLDRPLGDHIGWLGYGYNTDNSFFSGRTAETAGYPGDLTPAELDQYYNAGNALSHSVTTHQFRSNTMDTAGGQSGSSIYYDDSQSDHISYSVVSHGSYTDSNGNGQYDPGEPIHYNASTRLDQTKFDSFQNGRTEDDTARPPSDLPDLADYDKWFDSSFAFANKTSVVPSELIDVTSYVTNIGTEAASTFTVRYRLSTDTIYDTADAFLGDVNVSSVNPFNWTTVLLDDAVVPNIAPGNYFVVWSVDAFNDVVEFGNLDEANINFGALSTQVTVGAAPADDAYEENDTLATAADPLSNGGQWEQTWLSSIAGPGIQADDDWYRIEITPGFENLVVDLQFSHAEGDIDIQVINPGGAIIAASTSTTDDESIDVVLPSSGTYYLFVYYADAGNSYDLWWDDLINNGTDDHGNNAGAATPVTVNSTTGGVIETAGDVDWFSFPAQAGADYELATQLGTLSDSVLTLYDQDGATVLAFNDDSGGTLASLINWTAPASGTYYAEVRGYNINTGGYDLSITETINVPGEIHGAVWNDIDGDAVFEPLDGETPIPNWRVYLDLDNSGTWDSGVEPSQLTDGNGQYAFTGLAPGTYTVAQVLQTGWDQTAPGSGAIAGSNILGFGAGGSAIHESLAGGKQPPKNVRYEDPQIDDAFVTDGRMWPQPGGLGTGVTVTYSYSNLLDGGLLGGLTTTQIRTVVEEALDLWATFAPFNFVEVTDSGPAPSDATYPAAGHPDIRIGHHAIDGASSVLAHAYFPPPNSDGLAGDMHFDSGDSWGDGISGGSIDLLEVTVHELGHALGLRHEPTTGENAIMNPFYGARYSGPGTAFLLPDDIAGIQAIYGSVGGPGNGTWTVQVNSGDVITDIDFGNRLPGDFDADQDLDRDDVDLLTAVGDLTAGVPSASAGEIFDLIDDDVIDGNDLDHWLAIAATFNGFATPYLPGDADLDHDIDTVDLTTSITNFTGAGGTGKVWSKGDFDGDGDVDTVDVTDGIINFTGAQSGQSASASSNERPESLQGLLQFLDAMAQDSDDLQQEDASANPAIAGRVLEI